jgi:hypothetical protein
VRFPKLSGRPEYSSTVVLIALLEMKNLALLVVLLFGTKHLAKPIVLVIEKLILCSEVVKQSRHLFGFGQ